MRFGEASRVPSLWQWSVSGHSTDVPEKHLPSATRGAVAASAMADGAVKSPAERVKRET
jgi:hypothetical protein